MASGNGAQAPGSRGRRPAAQEQHPTSRAQRVRAREGARVGRHRRAGLRRQPTSPMPLRTPPSSEPPNTLTRVMYKCGLEICLNKVPLNFMLHPGSRKQRGALQGCSGGQRTRGGGGGSEQTLTGCLGTGKSKKAARYRRWESPPGPATDTSCKTPAPHPATATGNPENTLQSHTKADGKKGQNHYYS